MKAFAEQHEISATGIQDQVNMNGVIDGNGENDKIFYTSKAERNFAEGIGHVESCFRGAGGRWQGECSGGEKQHGKNWGGNKFLEGSHGQVAFDKESYPASMHPEKRVTAYFFTIVICHSARYTEGLQ